MIRLLPALVGALLSIAAVGVAPVAAADPPATVVVLGDSAAAGDGAGDYEPGTRGENGNWCHRSPHAYVHRTGLAPESVNLACSGAAAADVAFGTGRHYMEGSQADRLTAVARDRRVTTVVLQVGANDDIALTSTAVTCVRAFLDPTVPPCRQTIGPLVADRATATARKVEAAARDVREAMRRAGYVDSTYAFVLASYASPVTEHMVPMQGAVGCPYSRPDAGWGRTSLFPQTSDALRGVATRVGARFLDLVRVTEGFEACSRALPTQEWQRRITVDPHAFVYGGLEGFRHHLAQESFHPTTAAHAGIGRCLGAFVRGGAAEAACVASPDGTVRLEGPRSAPPAAA